MEIIGGGKMEGSYFYFLSWCGWIIVTFWMGKHRVRLFAAASILFVIIGSQAYIPIGDLRITASYIVITCICFLGISRYTWWKKVHGVTSAVIIAMIYAIFHMIELYDPIWIVINRTWMLSAIMSYASFLLIRQHMLRVFAVCMGAVQGEAFLAVGLKIFGFHDDIGATDFLDSVACSVSILCVAHVVIKGILYVQPFRQKHVREGQG
jgi:hypothetical protein